MTTHARPYSNEVWSERELWSRDRLADFQLAALKTQLASVAGLSGLYRRVFEAAGFEPGDLRTLDDLRRLPVTRKADYLASLEESPPWGSVLACRPEEIVRVHFSSGTTSRPAPACWTARDLDRWADLYARYLYAQGLRRGDVLQCMFGYAWFVGGLGATQAALRIGAALIPAGSGDSKRQIETIRHYGTTAVIGTPSFVAHLAEVAAEMGVDLRASTVRQVCVGGEPGASIPGTRARIEALWGARTFDCYGTLECQPIGWDTASQLGPTLAEDFVYCEVLDARTLEPVPDGIPGVLVVTHLDKEACPLVRWWTGDVVVRDSTPAPDGRTHARLAGGVRGRADDMLVVRGVNVFPSAVEDLLRRMPEVAGEYVIVLDDSVRDPKTGFLTGIKLRVEAWTDAPADLAGTIAHRVREGLLVRAVVEVVPPGTLPRSVHKAARIVKA